MRKSSVTLENVRQAKQWLRQRGERESADAIRAHLGSGSKTTILRLMAVDRDAELIGAIDEPPIELPDVLLRALSDAATTWYGQAKVDLIGQLDDARELLREEAQQHAEVVAEAAVALSRVDQLEGELEKVREDFVSAKSEIGALVTELRRAQHQLAEALGLAASEKSRADAAQAAEREARAATGSELKVRIGLERENAALTVQLESTRLELAGVRTDAGLRK